MRKEIFVFLVMAFVLLSSEMVVGAFDESLVSDARDATEGVLSGGLEVLNEYLSPFFGDKEVLTRVFFFLLLYMILYSIISTMFKGRKLMTHGVSIIVTSLSLMALPVNFIEAIRGQYGAMGAAILSIIPFAIILMFTAKLKNLLIARLLWIFFVVYYFALYVYMVWNSGGAGWVSGEVVPYLFAIVAGILIFFFIGKLRSALFKGEMGALEEEGEKVVERAKILHKLQKKEVEGYTKG